MRLLTTPPGRVFHGLCLLVAGVVLWSATVPGGTVLGLLVGIFGTALLALAWFVRLVLAVYRRTADRRFAVGPAGGVLLLVLLLVGAPLQARWAVSRGAFEDAVREERRLAQPGEVERIGAYRVISIEQVGGGTVFMLASTGFLDAGFAHLPAGPAPVLAADRFEAPEFVPLGGGWYRWTSSW